MYDDLEILITTYNRAEFLKETLISICEQSAPGFDILVLDNASTDNTKEVFEGIKKQYPSRNMVFVGSEKNIGGVANIDRARKMAKKEWAMLFHDDDLMHPDYVKNAMDLLAQHPDAVMVSCTYTPLENPDDKNWEAFSNDAYVTEIKDFAALMFGFIMHNFASTIYKTALLKECAFKENIYGKILDRPFMLDVAKHGKTLILKDPYIRYRLHPGQDTNTAQTGPYANEYFALMNCYKSILGNSWFDKYGIIYNSFIHYQLKLGYHWLKSVNSVMKFNQFKNMAAENNVIRNFERFKIVEKIYRLFMPVCKKIFY